MLIGVIAEELLLPNWMVEAVSALESVDASIVSVGGGTIFSALVTEAAGAADIADAALVANAVVVETATAASTQDAAMAGVSAIDEAATADSVQDATVTGAGAARSAMLPEAFVNSDTSREANVAGIMVNI